MSDEPIHKESLPTETIESVPNVNQKPEERPVYQQQMAYHGEVHLDAAGQVTPGPKPPVRHEHEVDEEGKTHREGMTNAGWPPAVVDLNRPTVVEPPPATNTDGTPVNRPQPEIIEAVKE